MSFTPVDRVNKDAGDRRSVVQGVQFSLPPISFFRFVSLHHCFRKTPRKMAVAKWNGEIIAECTNFQMCEGNVYFPPGSLKQEFFQPSETQTRCGWKGVASYYNVVVNGKVNKVGNSFLVVDFLTSQDACWYYPNPLPEAKYIEGYYAFWKGVNVTKKYQESAEDKTPAGAKC